MTQYTTPARVRFPRLTVSGAAPDVMAPGSLAFNLADTKVYVGDLNGLPIRFSQWLDEWQQALAYRTGDFALRNGEIWQSEADIGAGLAFNPAQWRQLTSASRSASSEPYMTGVIDGGKPTLQRGAGVVSFAAGSGVIVNNEDPSSVTNAVISWGAFTASTADLGVDFTVVGIDASGSATVISATDPDLPEWRRNNIELARLGWTTPEGGQRTTTEVVDSSIRVGGTANAQRDEYFLNGGAYSAFGNRLGPGAAPLSLNRTEGGLFGRNAKWRDDPESPNTRLAAAEAPVQLELWWRGRDPDAPVAAAAVDPTQWDNNGILQPVPAGQATIQYVSMEFAGSTTVIEYGQTLYSSVSAARLALSEDSLEFQHTVDRVGYAALAAVIIEGDATEVDPSAVIPAQPGNNPFEGYDPDVTGESFYRLDGTRPLAGDMDAAGFAINDADISGGDETGRDNNIRIQRTNQTNVVPAPTSAADYGEISANIVDSKIFVRDAQGIPRLTATVLKQHNTSVQYIANDTCIHDNLLYYALRETGPGVFDHADWQAVSSSATGGNAIIIDPATGGRNTITTTGNVEGLVIDGDAGQTARLLEITPTQPGDAAGAYIDAQSFPGGHFAPTTRRVVQVDHGFPSSPGLALSITAGLWELADATVAGEVIAGVLEALIDQNTFVVRTAGEHRSLSTAAFEGGSITIGEVYYASEVNPGKLTSTPTTSNIPVLITTSSTTGTIIPGGGASGLSSFVQKSGDTMSGNLVMDGVTQLRFKDTRGLKASGSDPTIIATISGAQALVIGEAGTALSDAQMAVTREKGDGRYVRLGANNTITGNNTLQGVTNFEGGTFHYAPVTTWRNDGIVYWSIQDAAGETRQQFQFDRDENDVRLRLATAAGALTTRYTFEQNGQMNEDTSVATQGVGDNRWAQLSGATFTGQVINEANSIWKNDGIINLSAQNADGTSRSQLRFGPDNDVLVRTADGAGSLTTRYTFEQDGGLDENTSVVTRANGDARYLQTDAAAPDALIAGSFSGDGTKTGGTGFSVTRTSQGRYTVTFDTNRGDGSYTCVPSMSGSSGGAANVELKTGAAVEIRCLDSSGDTRDRGVNFMVVG